MALTDQVLDATTGAAAQTAETPAISGPTHQTSGPSGPDPTGLRGTLEKNFAASAEKAVAEQNDRKKPKDAVSRETDPAAASQNGERGPDGKFLPKAASPTTAAPQPDEAPSTWRAETKALWKEIDTKFGPEQGKLLKEELRKRENDFRSGIAAKDAEMGKYKPVAEQFQNMIQPHVAQWQQQGIQPAQAVQHLLTLSENFRKDPAATIKWLAQSAGLELSTLASGATPAGGTATDPQLAPLLQQINGLQSKLSAIETSWASQTTAAATAEIQSVIDEKGADGQPVRPHFNDVFEDIKDEMQILRAKHPDWSARQTAAAAYDTAVWRNPQTRQKMIEGTEATKRASEDAAARQRAAEAAAKNVRGGPPNQINGAANPSNLRGMLEQRVGAHYNGASRL